MSTISRSLKLDLVCHFFSNQTIMLIIIHKEAIQLDFVHLQIQTAYSLLDSACGIDALVNKADELGFQSLAITDKDVLYGAVPFYKACKRAGINPIIGLTLSVQPISKDSDLPGYPVILLAENEIGYRHLIKLSTMIQTKDLSGIPLDVLKRHQQGLFAIVPFKGEVHQLILNGNRDQAQAIAGHLFSVFKEKLFLSLEFHGKSSERAVNEEVLALCRQLNIESVVTNDVHFIEKKDAYAFQSLKAIKNGVKLDENVLSQSSEQQYYLKSSEEMLQLFPSTHRALENTKKIADRCKVDLKFGQPVLPKYPLPPGETSSTFLKNLCFEGAQKKFNTISAKIEKRLNYELAVLDKMNFNDYFLIVWDFMKFAHTNGIMTGPGRGSAAGSLVAYVLNITNVDPIEHGLLFERFLNPERVTLPDIDIDFPDTQRDQVIRYVANKYGEDHVAQIVTFGTLAARASIRDVGRVMALSTAVLDKITRLIPGRPGTTLRGALKESAALRELVSNSAEVKKMFETAMTIEGLPRHTSTHAAGVVISAAPLTDVVPLQQGHDGVALTQYSMEILEASGLLKMDFLGLRNLTLLQNILKIIREKTGKQLDLDKIPFDDKKTFDLLSNGDTNGVFQLESEGMKRILTQLRPTEFEDIVAVNALYRPGPMENIPDYIARKHGKAKVEYPHSDLKPILERTYGVIVYQEQIMKIASAIAGFSLGEADILRRAVSKKKKDVLDKERVHFTNGCLKNGYKEETAHLIYDLIVKFANYGFNRSHAVAYSVIAYQLAYLKANYPLYFVAAILTSVIGNEEKIALYIREAKRKGISILAPSINKSSFPFSVEKDGIRFSLAAVKNVGIAVLKEVLKHRREQPYKDLFDFCARVSKGLNRRVVESLVMAGSFDEFNVDRSTLLASIDVAFDYAELVGEDDSGLFLGDDLVPKPQYVKVDPMEIKDRIQFEKEVFGFFLSNHPIESHRKLLERWGAIDIMTASEGPVKAHVKLGVYVSEKRVIKTKQGKQMAFLTFSDESGEIDAVLFPNVFELYTILLQKELLFCVKGVVDERDGKRQVIVNGLLPLKVLTNQVEQCLYLKIEKEHEESGTLMKVKQALKKHRGLTEVVLYYSSKGKTVRLSPDWGVQPDDDCIHTLTKLLGKTNVVLKMKSLQ
jgi:DNA polymerase-3 subunit alpha